MLKPIKERQIPLPLPDVRTSLQRVLIPGFPAASPTAGSVSNWADPKWILCPSGEHMRTVQHFEDNVRWRKNMICWCIILMYGCRYMYGIPAWCLESSKTVIWSARMWRFTDTDGWLTVMIGVILAGFTALSNIGTLPSTPVWPAMKEGLGNCSTVLLSEQISRNWMIYS